jgi:hypothetical protein
LQEAYVEHDGAKVLIAEIEAGGPDDEFYDAKVQVLAEMIEHHVKEEEKRVEGMFSQARKAGVDVDELGTRMAAAKKQLLSTYQSGGLPNRRPQVSVEQRSPDGAPPESLDPRRLECMGAGMGIVVSIRLTHHQNRRRRTCRQNRSPADGK